MVTQVSTMLLPVLVVALLGPEQSGYLLPAQTIFTRSAWLAVLQAGQAAVLVGGTVAPAGPAGLVAVGWAAPASQVPPAPVLTPSVVRWLRVQRPLRWLPGSRSATTTDLPDRPRPSCWRCQAEDRAGTEDGASGP